MDKKTSLRINNRRETTFGVASIVLGILSLVLFVIAVYNAAYDLQGNEVTVGVTELIAIIFCLTGLLFGIVGELRLDKFHRTAHIGIATNLIVGILHVFVLVHGY